MSRRGAVLVVAALVVAACSPGRTERRASVPATPHEAPSRARWIAVSAVTVDSRDGIDRVIVDGRRLDVRGFEVVGAAPALPEVDGGARLPSWAKRGDVGFVFWRRDAVYVAPSFDGPLRLVGRAADRIERAFDWLSGVGLDAGGATLLVDGGGHLGGFGAPATSIGLAIDARHAARLTAFGDVRFTADGGASWRDVPVASDDARPFRRGDAIAIDDGGAIRELDARGELVAGPSRPLEPPVDEGEPWPGGRRGAVAALTASGAMLGDGGAIIVGDGHLGRIDLATLRTTSIAVLPGVDEATTCEPFRAKDGWLVLCQSESEAKVFEVDGAPRLERTFAPLLEDLDRFVASDETGALGFVGPCDGREPPLVHDASEREFPAASPVFCARAPGGAWIEHAVSRDEAAELVTWIPRPGGAAAVLVAPALAKLDLPAVEQRGELRVVRVARDAPPAPFAILSGRGASLIDRAFMMDASGAIEGWLPVGGATGRVPIRVDPDGAPTLRALPFRTIHLVPVGPKAIAVTDDGAYHQSVDRGRTWTRMEPPPASVDAGHLKCGPAGCALGGLTRLGWDSAAAGQVDAPLPLPRPERSRAHPEPVARLVCHGAEPPRSSRQEEPIGFGVSRPSALPSSSVVPVHDVGVVIFPPSAGLVVKRGDVEADLAWIAPLDPTARVRRVHLAAARVGVSPQEIPYLGLSVAPILRADGDVDLMPAHSSDACFDTLLETAGIVRRGFGCFGREALGVEIGERAFIADPHGGKMTISTRALDASPAASPAIEATTRFARRRWFGLGSRAKKPVAVFVDLDGGAVLVPIDPVRGQIGREEPLRALSELELGSSPACRGGRGDGALVLLSFEGAIAIDVRDVIGLSPGDERGLAIVRWSPEHACLEAVRLPVRDERVDPDPSAAGPTMQRRLVGRFDGRGGARATLVDVGPGVELRQTLACDRVEPH